MGCPGTFLPIPLPLWVFCGYVTGAGKRGGSSSHGTAECGGNTTSISTSSFAPFILLGDTGGVGAVGAKGDTGSQGLKGDAGQNGVAGPKGDAGADGKDGTDGQDGAKGEKGAAGSNGVAGNKGDKGENGLSGKLWMLLLWSSADLW